MGRRQSQADKLTDKQRKREEIRMKKLMKRKESKINQYEIRAFIFLLLLVRYN